MMMIRTLIIDDEALNRDFILKLVQKTNANFEIVGDVDNIDDGYDSIIKLEPDLILLDIKMPNGNGFDLLKRFEKPNFEVVFITGFDEYALQAFEFNALDYILKPIDVDKLKNTLEKVYNRITSKLLIVNNFKEILNTYDPENYIITKIPIHYNDKVELLDINDIVAITANNGYTNFKTIRGNELIAAKHFYSFEFIIEKHPFLIKINRGTYININFIKNYTKGDPCFVELLNNYSFEISRRKKTEILHFLDLKKNI